MVIAGACLTSCSGVVNDGRALTWEDLFKVAAPVAASDALSSMLASRLSDDQAARGGRQAGRVPVSVLRAGQFVPGSADGHGSDFATTTASGERLAAAMSPAPRVVLETPYWTSVFRRLGAMGGGRTFVATSLCYPIFVYDEAGHLQDSLGSPPPSWRQARRPKPGEFPPERGNDWNAYLRSFTVLEALAVVADSVLVVSHGQLVGRGEEPYRLVPTTVDVYVGQRKIATDLPSPGALVAYSNTRLFFLQRLGRAERATLTEYVWRAGY